MPTVDTIIAEAFRAAVVLLIAGIAFTGARSRAATERLSWRTIAGFLAVAAFLALVAYGRTGTITTEESGDPLRPEYVTVPDPDRPPPTRAERRTLALAVFAIITIPGVAGFAIGRRDRARPLRPDPASSPTQ